MMFIDYDDYYYDTDFMYTYYEIFELEVCYYDDDEYEYYIEYYDKTKGGK